MTTPTWLAQARCRQLRLPTEWFVPGDNAQPHPDAVRACAGCPVAAPCAADRGGDVGLRGDGFVPSRRAGNMRTLTCGECGVAFKAAGGGYTRCGLCAGRRRSA